MPNYNFRGFSLIELLVVVALIGIVVGVSVPNLRKFSSTQEIEATASQLSNALRTAQSSAGSHVKCPNNMVSSNWNVVLNSSRYIINCLALGVDRQTHSSAYATAENPSSAFSMSSDKCGAQELKFIFINQQISYLCGGIAGSSWPVRITLSNGAGLSKVLVVEAGGVIRAE